MKKILLLVMMFLLVGCQKSDGQLISKEIIHYHTIEKEGDDYLVGDITYSECKTYKNGRIVSSYTIGPDGGHSNISNYKYRGGLLKRVERIDGIHHYVTKYTYKGDKKKSIVTYHNDEEVSKTLYDYEDDAIRVTMYTGGELYSESYEKTKGNVKLVELTLFPEGIKENLQITLDDHDNPVHYVVDNGQEIVETYKTYDEYNNLIHLESTSGEEINITYDDHGNKISEISSFMNSTYEYVYNDHGDYLEKKTYRDGYLRQCITREVTYGK